MSEKTISHEFSAKGGANDLEIFLLRGEARRNFQEMGDRHALERARLASEQRQRHSDDIRAAKIDLLAQQAKPELAPKGHPRGKPLKESELQAAAESRVDARNAAAQAALEYEQRQREDAFLAQQKEQRLIREAVAARQREEAPGPPKLKQEFDRER